MKKIFFLVLISFFSFYPCSAKETKNAIFQVSTINALIEGVYDGDMTLKSLGRQGNFGIGTFNSLDGEMILNEGNFYQAKSDGTICKKKLLLNKTPFATVCFFSADKSFQVTNLQDFKSLQLCLDEICSSKNAFYAFKIKGDFDYIKIRSVPAQKKPYPMLNEVVKNQSQFELKNQKGVLIGFRTPEYFEKLNVPGYHFHFLSNDKQLGGHVLDIKLRKAIIEVEKFDKFTLKIPDTKEFNQSDISQDRRKELNSSEK